MFIETPPQFDASDEYTPPSDRSEVCRAKLGLSAQIAISALCEMYAETNCPEEKQKLENCGTTISQEVRNVIG